MHLAAGMKRHIAESDSIAHWADSSSVLTEKVAQQCLKDRQRIVLLQYTSIEPSAADILSRC